MIATDGSPSAHAALVTARSFPGPRASHVRGVVVSPYDWLRSRSPRTRRAFTATFEHLAATAGREIARRWPNGDVVHVTGRPAETILRQARRFGADVIVVGWRGHGAFRRLLTGSVSRSVVEGARGAVLVVRRPVRAVRRIVIGVDGSANATRAVDFVARMAPEGASVTVVRVVEPKTVPTVGRLPASIRNVILSELAALKRRLVREARRDVSVAVARLKRAGWNVRGEIQTGAPLASLLDVVDRTGADIVVVGARAKTGVERALLGSVVAGALDHSRVPVLVVR